MSESDRTQLQNFDQSSARRPYRKPELQVYGSIQDLTRAGAGSKKEPGGPPVKPRP